MKTLMRFADKLILLLSVAVKPFTAYLLFLMAALVFTLPILFAGVDYIDDNARRLGGYYDWGSLGRFITEGVMRFLTFGGDTMPDMGIQMQLMAIPVLALTGWVLSRSLSHKKSMSVGQLMPGLLLVFNPFLLTNLSFRYDSFAMMLGYLLAVVAAVMVARSNKRLHWAGAVVVLVLSAALYQPMISMFIMTALSLFVYSYAQDSHKDEFKRLIASVGVFVAGCISYFAILKLVGFSNIGGASRGELIPISVSGIRMAFGNIRDALEVSMMFFATGWGKIIVSLLIVVLVVGMILIVRAGVKKRRWYETAVVVATPSIILLCSMGPFSLMVSSITAQVRTLGASIGIILLIGVIIYVCLQAGRRYVGIFGVGVLALFVLFALNFSAIYGSALSNQREHDKVVYDEIDDYILQSDEMQSDGVVVNIGGEVSTPRTVDRLLEKRPLLARMDVAGDNSMWYLWMMLTDRGVMQQVNWYTYSYAEEVLRKQTCEQVDGGKVYESAYYSIFRHGNAYYLWLSSDGVESSTFCSGIRL